MFCGAQMYNVRDKIDVLSEKKERGVTKLTRVVSVRLTNSTHLHHLTIADVNTQSIQQGIHDIDPQHHKQHPTLSAN